VPDALVFDFIHRTVSVPITPPATSVPQPAVNETMAAVLQGNAQPPQ